MSPPPDVHGRPRVAIIGGGIFGVTAALVLAQHGEVDIFERSGDLLQGATLANHGRQHLGFHYPRSAETAQQCLRSRADFQSFYANAEVEDFPNYYAVAGEDSKVSPEQYLKFCRQHDLRFERENPPEGILSANQIALSLKVREGVIDYMALRETALSLLKAQTNIRLRTHHTVTGGKFLADGKKELVLMQAAGSSREAFDFVVNATYAHANAFCGWFGFQPRNFQFNLQELNVIELSRGLRLGVTIMDGAFPSILPMGRTGYHLLAHVNASQLIRETSCHAQPLLSRISAIESNWEGVLSASAEYLPILHEARYVKSFFVDRVVEANASATDARLTDLTDHGSGCYSIFAAKVITCVTTARKLAETIFGKA